MSVIHDGWLVPRNVVREDGRRSVLLSNIKNGNVPTLDVINRGRHALRTIRAWALAGLAQQPGQQPAPRVACDGIAITDIRSCGTPLRATTPYSSMICRPSGERLVAGIVRPNGAIVAALVIVRAAVRSR